MAEPQPPSAGPLSGFAVVDLSTGIPGGYCTKILADGGAQIIKVEAPEGDPLRRWSASGAQIGYGRDGALFTFLAGGKHAVVADPQQGADMQLVDDLLAGADAVVWSPDSALARRFTPQQIRSSHPHLIVAAITAFGLSGPWSGRAATEFTLQAWSGGIVGLGRGAADRAPVYVGGRVGDYLSGAYASAAVLAARMRVIGGGPADLIDLSMLECHVLGLTYFPVTYFQMLGRPWRDARRPTVPGIAQAADGLVDIGCGTAQQWFDLCAMTGHEDWIDVDSPLSITEQANEKAAELYGWIAERTGEEVRELATAFRIPNAPVVSGATIETFDHFRARRSFVTNPAGFRQPGHPYRLSGVELRPPSAAPRLGEHTEHYRRSPGAPRRSSGNSDSKTLPLNGIRVIDMTTFWAGPSCTHPMALLGADVIHVESIRRPDGARLIGGVPVTEDQWWERQPIFASLNTNKKDITVDLGSERGRELLTRLIGTADVIAENYTPRVLDQLGLDFAGVQRIRPDAILLRMPGFGLDGPWRDNPAFAYVIEAAAGISWLTGYPDRTPFEPYSVGDPNAGLHALNGVLLALEHRRRTGRGCLVEAAMVDAAISIAAELHVEYSAYGAVLQRAGNRGPGAVPQNLYQTSETDEFGREDCWVAIAIEDDQQWHALRSALDDPPWAADPGLCTPQGRRAAQDRIDAHLADWCRQRTGDQIVAALWPAGVPVAKVMQPHRQTELDQLVARGFFESVEHPVTGPAQFSTLPFRLTGGPQRFHRDPPPLLGEHNHELLGALGLGAAEIAELEADGIIGTRPAG